jgi:hypothetical protein
MADAVTVALFERILSGALVTVPVLSIICWQLWQRLKDRDDKFDAMHQETLEALHSLREAIKDNRR